MHIHRWRDPFKGQNISLVPGEYDSNFTSTISIYIKQNSSLNCFDMTAKEID